MSFNDLGLGFESLLFETLLVSSEDMYMCICIMPHSCHGVFTRHVYTKIYTLYTYPINMNITLIISHVEKEEES